MTQTLDYAALYTEIRNLLEANRVTQIGNRLGGGENERFRDWLGGKIIAAVAASTATEGTDDA